MAYGGGTFSVKNKVLPGSYINFVSVNNVDLNVSERGVVAVCRALSWGPQGMIVITREEFQRNARKYFGMDCDSGHLWFLREIFKYSNKALVYNANVGGAVAKNEFGKAKYSGLWGNRIKVEVLENYDGSFTVTTYFDALAVDVQQVAGAAYLKDNEYVVFDKKAALAETAIGGVAMEGGQTKNSTTAYVDFLNELENYSFNVLVCDLPFSNDPDDADSLTREMFVEYTRRRRDSDGVKFQTILFRCPADYEGIISLQNVYDDGDEYDYIFWVAGVCAGLTAGQSATNMKYDGELDINATQTDFNKSELESMINEGKFVFHKVNDELRVLSDINSLTTTSDVKGSVFKENQTIRICDQIANDIAGIFNAKYLGRVPNDKAGRLSLWNEIVKFHEQLQEMRAIEDFDEESVVVEIGETKTSVVVYETINVINGMGQLYMTVTVA